MENNPAMLVWQENLDGLGTFGTRQIIFQDIDAYTIAVDDIDNDGDLDIFANLYETGQTRISWFENTDGQGTFGTENLIETGEFYGDGGGSKILIFDLDNDGDKDVITSYESFQPSEIIWYENLDGQGTLAAPQLLFQYLNVLSDWMSIFEMRQADINVDGKMDIVVTGYYDNYPYAEEHKIEWLENIDGAGQFSFPQNIDNYLPKTMFVYDLDNDGDEDVLKTDTVGPNSSISWFKNTDGLGSFGAEQIITTEVDNIVDSRAADIDGDGLLDVISASTADNKLAWYKNEFLSTPSFTAQDIFLYPNPVSKQLFVQSQFPLKKLVIKNYLGQEVISQSTPNGIDVSTLESGVYLVLVETQDGKVQTQKIIKK